MANFALSVFLLACGLSVVCGQIPSNYTVKWYTQKVWWCNFGALPLIPSIPFFNSGRPPELLEQWCLLTTVHHLDAVLEAERPDLVLRRKWGRHLLICEQHRLHVGECAQVQCDGNLHGTSLLWTDNAVRKQFILRRLIYCWNNVQYFNLCFLNKIGSGQSRLPHCGAGSRRLRPVSDWLQAANRRSRPESSSGLWRKLWRNVSFLVQNEVPACCYWVSNNFVLPRNGS